MIFQQVIISTLNTPPMWHWSTYGCCLHPRLWFSSFFLLFVKHLFLRWLFFYFRPFWALMSPSSWMPTEKGHKELSFIANIPHWFGLHNSQVLCFLLCYVSETRKETEFSKGITSSLPSAEDIKICASCMPFGQWLCCRWDVPATGGGGAFVKADHLLCY